MVANECIAEKGSFSLAVPGGSVVAALGGLDKDAFDFSKTHIFFCNEKIPSYPCIDGALKETQKIGLPDENVHAFAKTGSPQEIADAYTSLMKSHPSIDNSRSVPSVDMMLLGTGGDGHCGCIFPESAEVKQSGEGKVVLAGNDDRADGDFVAVSMDIMCAAKTVLVSAAGEGRAEMVAKALSGEFGAYDCPAGMVEAQDETICACLPPAAIKPTQHAHAEDPRNSTRPVAPHCTCACVALLLVCPRLLSPSAVESQNPQGSPTWTVLASSMRTRPSTTRTRSEVGAPLSCWG